MRHALLACGLLAACTPALPIFDDGGGGGVDAGGSDAGGSDGSVRDGGDAGGGDAGGCPAGFADCDGAAGNGCERELGQPDACGGCTDVCAPTRDCVDYVCEVPGIRDMMVAGGFTCVLLDTGRAFCWGTDDRGQLGDGFSDGTTAGDRPNPEAVVNLTDLDAMYGNASIACAVDAAGVGSCWGQNSPEKFGDGMGLARVSTPEPLVFMGVPEPVLELREQVGHLCVRTASSVQCSGANSLHALGRDGANSRFLTPVTGLPSISGTRSVAAGFTSGAGFGVVALADGTVWAWGTNDNGECGQPASSEVYPAQAIAGLTDIVQVAAGVGFACALDNLGTVRCWGNNSNGELGAGPGPDSSTPTVIPGIPAMRRLHLGLGSVLAETLDGHQVWAWGDNSYNLLGLGPAGPSTATPRAVLIDMTGDYEARICGTHSCLIRRRAGEDDAVLCAGSNMHYALGMMTATDPTRHVEVPNFP
ncbi:MAG: RCC1 domain-containing protein [Sandaracinaceae bacterium]